MRLRKLRPNEVWSAIERLAQYEDEGWNDALIPDDVGLNHENPDIKQLLGIIEHKVDTLMKDAISLMKKSESVFQLLANKMYRQLSEPSSQEEFKHIAMSKRSRSTRGQASSSREETIEEKVRKFGLFDNENHQMNYNNIVRRFIHSGDVVAWEFLSNKGLDQPFFDFINTDNFSGP
ncbi:hypothetical protein Tco_1464693 [Tanacetum coccineum]